MKKCICIKETPGNQGLNGYFLNEIYQYKVYKTEDNVESEYDEENDMLYIEVYNTWDDSHYDYCGMTTFKRFFKPIH